MRQVEIIPMSPPAPRHQAAPRLGALVSPDRMTDNQIVGEIEACNADIRRAIFWGDDVVDAQGRRDALEKEQFRRRVAAIRARDIDIQPFICDATDVRRQALSPIVGAAKGRIEVAMPACLRIALSALLLCAFVGVVAAVAAPRIIELDARYAAMDRR